MPVSGWSQQLDAASTHCALPASLSRLGFMEITDHLASQHAHELTCSCACLGKAKLLAGKPGDNSEKFETV